MNSSRWSSGERGGSEPLGTLFVIVCSTAASITTMNSKFASLLSFVALPTLLLGGCNETEDESPDAAHRMWTVESVQQLEDYTLYEVRVDDVPTVVGISTTEDSTEVVVEAAQASVWVSGYAADGSVVLVDGLTEQALDLDSDDPFTQLSLVAALDGELELADDQHRFGTSPWQGEGNAPGGHQTVLGRRFCEFRCNRAKSSCDGRNTRATGNDLLEPCELEHDICISEC
ncbi:MAG: hypothetical protein ACRBN8_24310 [Nannocystales bacterium]